MTIVKKTIPNLYRDSVSLMQFTEQIKTFPGVLQASAVMATENNLSLLLEAGLLDESLPVNPNHLLLVVESIDETAALSALEQAEKLLHQRPKVKPASEQGELTPRSIWMALEILPGANLALISTPGEYAAAEALKALRLGLNVMLFSDNVSLEDELALKQYAREHDLLVMGPDCGTAIIGGIPLGFANVVRPGNIGVVAAAGTGLQQVTSLIDRLGGGISQGIGTGSHDLHRRIGGITMLQGITALAADPGTRVIVLISKPPEPEVAIKVLEQAIASGKKVVVDFIGADPATIHRPGIYAARTLEEAAHVACQLAEGQPPAPSGYVLPPGLEDQAFHAASQLTTQQRYIRGLFSGGTLCAESLLLLQDLIGPVYSNTPLHPQYRLPDVWWSREHTAIDLGDDLFTRGRPHPMIDFRLRNERILQEAADPEVAVILLDIVLGYGSNPDPAGELLPAIHQAHQIARQAGREIIFVGSVCGTRGDPQNLEQQEKVLRKAGVLLTESNAQATRLAAMIVNYAGGRL